MPYMNTSLVIYHHITMKTHPHCHAHMGDTCHAPVGDTCHAPVGDTCHAPVGDTCHALAASVSQNVNCPSYITRFLREIMT